MKSFVSFYFEATGLNTSYYDGIKSSIVHKQIKTEGDYYEVWGALLRRIQDDFPDATSYKIEILNWKELE